MKEKSTGFGHDKTSFANMPQDVHMTAYPKSPHINTEMDDTIKGIDDTASGSIAKVRKNLSHQK
jgi:hypothetical protein